MRGNFIALLVLPITVFCQAPIRPYYGVFFAGDGAFEYYGPSLIIGADMPLNERSALSPFIQVFGATNAIGKFSTLSFAAVYQRYYVGESRRLYIGVGLAFQHAKLDSWRPEYSFERSIVVPAYRIGFVFNTKKMAICPEINVSGPYSYKTNFGSTTELFTLPSIGIRMYRRDRDKSGRRIQGS